MSFSTDYFFQCLVSGAKYIHITLFIGLLPTFVGITFGCVIALARIRNVPFLSKLLEVLVSVQVGVPLMVNLLIFYLVYLVLLPSVKYGAMATALLALSLNRIAYQSEIIRGAFLSIPKIQYEAGYSIGLSYPQVLRRIAIPQMIPVAIPPLTNNIVGGVKNTSIVMVVGIVDVLNGSAIPCADTYSYVEGYVAAALIYWGISAVLEFSLHKIEVFFNKGRNVK
ncbi:amino acid ABC transporter permease [Treponema saccharophilum]|uniref:Binding-protein-dependent transport systems inner membrane component n=1 Tax=Treponema saccharophilum DSM 2985 TaxID=907348 RepID=H7ELX7_9SPIR|nr:amino acid ABC transporter permease [Treponema saccharophilum]EIC01385.1 binding-protein-dependent transport systems inner membrane component [Treponema saccharophilum DSM 2985]BDC97638.1 amino acid ABC transporter permease [Treponema saccharophilum]